MTRIICTVALGLFGIGVAAGCSSRADDKLVLAPADGIVTYRGSPLAGANVTFLPNNGPLATAVTDSNGKFTLRTGDKAGVAVGAVKVAVSAMPADPSGASGAPEFAKRPETKAEAEAYMKKAGEMALARRAKAVAGEEPLKSLIPERYNMPQTSDLAYTIKADGDNHFKIELVD